MNLLVPAVRILAVLTVISVAPISRVRADELPVPPIPPEHPPLAELAPIPNVDARVPTLSDGDAPSVDVKFYRARPYDPGLGFAPGSRYQSTEDRKPIQTPGLSISVPIK